MMSKTIPFKRDRARWELFFTALAGYGSLRKACEVVGCKRDDVAALRREDPDFEAQWHAAWADYDDSLEEEVHRRGKDGVDKPLVSKGEIITYVKEYSDTLLLAKVKSRIGTYREKLHVDHQAAPPHRVDLGKLSKRQRELLKSDAWHQDEKTLP